MRALRPESKMPEMPKKMPTITRPSDSILGGDSENSRRRSNRRSPTGPVLCREERQDRTPEQAWRDAGPCRNVQMECTRVVPSSSMGIRRRQELIEVIARLRGRFENPGCPGPAFYAEASIASRGSDPAVLHDGWIQILEGVEELLGSGLFSRRAFGDLGKIGDGLEGGLARHRAVLGSRR